MFLGYCSDVLVEGTTQPGSPAYSSKERKHKVSTYLFAYGLHTPVVSNKTALLQLIHALFTALIKKLRRIKVHVHLSS